VKRDKWNEGGRERKYVGAGRGRLGERETDRQTDKGAQTAREAGTRQECTHVAADGADLPGVGEVGGVRARALGLPEELEDGDVQGREVLQHLLFLVVGNRGFGGFARVR
jgi:hypothetical protein